MREIDRLLRFCQNGAGTAGTHLGGKGLRRSLSADRVQHGGPSPRRANAINELHSNVLEGAEACKSVCLQVVPATILKGGRVLASGVTLANHTQGINSPDTGSAFTTFAWALEAVRGLMQKCAQRGTEL